MGVAGLDNKGVVLLYTYKYDECEWKINSGNRFYSREPRYI
jgi:hypothetical protein